MAVFLVYTDENDKEYIYKCANQVSVDSVKTVLDFTSKVGAPDQYFELYSTIEELMANCHFSSYKKAMKLQTNLINAAEINVTSVDGLTGDVWLNNCAKGNYIEF